MGHIDGWVQVVGALLTGGVGVAIVVALANRKRVGADTADKILATGGTLIENAREDLKTARAERDHAHRRANRADMKIRKWFERADAHSQWDRDRIREARERGETLPALPPLFPPPDE